jgi:3-deoxy-7-phosphoheptulonate synthase
MRTSTTHARHDANGLGRATVGIGRASVGPATMTVVARLPRPDGAADTAAARDARAAGAHLLLTSGNPPQVAACREATGLPVAAEVAAAAEVGPAAAAADLLLVPGTSMGDGALLAAVAAAGRPVLLERSPGAGVAAWLEAAGRLAPCELVLCERGVTPAGPDGPTLLDLTVVPAVRAASGLPVIVDPTAVAADPDTLSALARAAAAAGADGVVVQAPAPEPADLAALVAEVREVAGLHGRRLDGARIRYVGAHR